MLTALTEGVARWRNPDHTWSGDAADGLSDLAGPVDGGRSYRTHPRKT